MTSPERDSRKKIIPILSIPGSAATSSAIAGDPEMVSLYESHKKIYPRSVSGLFSNWRWAMVWLTQLFFYGLPWLD